jgi:hypothetical protein
LEISHTPILLVKFFLKRNILKDNPLDLVAHLYNLHISITIILLYLAADGDQHMIINIVEITDILCEEIALVRLTGIGDLFCSLFLVALIIRKLFYLLLDLKVISKFDTMGELGVFIVGCGCYCSLSVF